MLTNAEIQNVVMSIAKQQLGESAVSKIKINEDSDLDGKDSLRITIVVKDSKTKLPGDKLSKIKIAVIDFLQSKGDFRFPYTHYSTTAELRAAQSA
ncbi:MAG: hypothetical protein V4441_06255 [Pseudomonadota bacterium]